MNITVRMNNQKSTPFGMNAAKTSDSESMIKQPVRMIPKPKVISRSKSKDRKLTKRLKTMCYSCKATLVPFRYVIFDILPYESLFIFLL